MFHRFKTAASRTVCWALAVTTLQADALSTRSMPCRYHPSTRLAHVTKPIHLYSQPFHPNPNRSFAKFKCNAKYHHQLFAQNPNQQPAESQSPSQRTLARDYFSLLRPVTLIQAVGAWVVGRLLVTQAQGSPSLCYWKELWAILAVYLSYGVGMVANDCVDAPLDAANDTDNVSVKGHRAIASGRIPVSHGWIFVGMLSLVSLCTAFVGAGHRFGLWCASNLGFMLLYAAGLQNFFILKNVLVGWLCISPLWGATTLPKSATATTMLVDPFLSSKMVLLAAAGFSLGVIREVLKDIQDIELDRGTKATLPLWIGETAAQRLSFAALGLTLAALQTPPYRRLFTTSIVPLYSTAWCVASGMCLRASTRPTIAQQQAGVKKSIYVLLLGLIGSMMLAS